MDDAKPPADGPASIPKTEAKPLSKPNPIYKYMGLGENFRPKLPSRNWMIFLSITGSFTAAVIYDKRETRRAQKKWSKLVEHIAKEPLDPKAMPRTLTVFLQGPPADGLRSAQDHFKEYVKPILVASGLDWQFIQGRKEGDIRAELAEKIRNSRLPPDKREQSPAQQVRSNSGVREFEGPRGDIVIGRHTWKEYVRGLHEGWLGPLVEPSRPVEANTPEVPEEPITTLPGITITGKDKPGSTESDSPLDATVIHDTSSPDDAKKPAPVPIPESKDEKPKHLAPFIQVSDYGNAALPRELPAEFDPSVPISFPHILGFLNTPRRIYRFLNRRKVADAIGRETAAIILSTYRPYHTASENLPTSFMVDESSPQADEVDVSQAAEQRSALFEEEKEWHKSTRVRKEDEPERTWLEPITLDSRIARCMRRSELTAEEEERAKSFVIPESDIEGWIKGGLRSLGRSGRDYLFGESKKPVAEGLYDEEPLP